MADLPQAISAAIPDPAQSRTGTVTAVAGSTVTVSVGGGTVIGKTAASYVPRVGDVVQMTNQGGSWLILGPVQQSGGWQQITSFSNGWTNGGTPLQYLVTSLGTFLVGIINPGTKTDTTIVFTMPAGTYSTTRSLDFPVIVSGSTTSGGPTPHFNLATNGVVVCYGCSGATAVSILVMLPLTMS